MTNGIEAFGATGKARTQTSGSGRSSGPDVSDYIPSENVVKFLTAAVKAGNGVAEFQVLGSNAARVSDLIEGTDNDAVRDILEGLQDDGVETVSLEGLFDVELEANGYEFIGTPPLLNETDREEFSQLDDETKAMYNDDDIYPYGDEDNGLKAYITKPEWLEVEAEGRINEPIINIVNMAMNGYYLPEIMAEFNGDEPVRLKASIGRNHNNKDENGNVDELSKRRHVAFSVERTSKTLDRIVSAAKNVGTIGDDDVENLKDGKITLEDIRDKVEANRE